MRIVDLTCIYPNSALSYDGRFVADLDRALVRDGAQVFTLVLKPWFPLWLQRLFPRYQIHCMPSGEFDDKGVRVRFVKYFHVPRPIGSVRIALNTSTKTRRALTILRPMASSIDMLHAVGLGTGVIASSISRELGLPFSVTLSDDMRHIGTDTHTPLYSRCMDAIEGASLLFAMGPSIFRQTQELLRGPSRQKVVLAPLGIDVPSLERMAAGFQRSPRSSCRRIVSVSSLFRWKGIHENLRALGQLASRGLEDWHYTAIGDGPYRLELESMARELGIGDRVTFTGSLPHGEAMRKLHDADIFSLPSFMEAFGQVFTEAAVMGVPAVGCLDNGPEAIIVDRETGLLVPPRDVDALAGALAWLMENPDRADAMGKRARLHIRGFTWEACAHRYKTRMEAVCQRVGRDARSAW